MLKDDFLLVYDISDAVATVADADLDDGELVAEGKDLRLQFGSSSEAGTGGGGSGAHVPDCVEHIRIGHLHQRG